MFKPVFPALCLLSLVLAFCSPSIGTSAQAIPTTQPTIVPTTVPTTAPSTQPAYIVPGLPQLVLGTPPPLHVMTADYYPTDSLVNNCAEQLEPYSTYIYPTSTAQYSVLHDCTLKVVLYMTPSMPHQGQQEYTTMTTNYAGAEAKDCSGNVITTYSGKGLLLDPHSSSALSYYQSVIDYYVSKYGAGNITAIFSDNSDEIYGESAQPCDWNGYADWTSATVAVLSKLNTHGLQIYLNDYSVPEMYSLPAADNTVANIINSVSPSTITGGEQEGFIYDLFPNHIDRWAWELNTEILSVFNKKIYWAYANHSLANVDPASSQGISIRLFLYSSWLLGYDPNYSIYQTWFNTPSGSRIMPETGIVPTEPIETATTDISQLQISPGLYERHFSKCYYRGVPLGPCVVVVNSSTSSVSINEPSYPHSLVLDGSDILDGGTVSFTGAQVVNLSANSGAILFQ